MELCILPLDYYPVETNEGFQDTVDEFTSLQFKEFGIKCNCNGKVYYNKYTFKAQHIKTQKHQEYLKTLIDDKPNLMKTLKEGQKTIKTLKIQLGTSELKLNQTLQKQKKISEKMDSFMNEILELKTQLLDRDEYIKDIEEKHDKEKQCLIKETAKYKSTFTQYEEKNNKTESILKQFMVLYDYEPE